MTLGTQIMAGSRRYGGNDTWKSARENLLIWKSAVWAERRICRDKRNCHRSYLPFAEIVKYCFQNTFNDNDCLNCKHNVSLVNEFTQIKKLLCNKIWHYCQPIPLSIITLTILLVWILVVSRSTWLWWIATAKSDRFKLKLSG